MTIVIELYILLRLIDSVKDESGGLNLFFFSFLFSFFILFIFYFSIFRT